MKSHPLPLAILMTVALPAFATSGFTPSTGEAGGTTHAMQSAKTRAEVLAEVAAWRRNPVTADGWREVGGEAGWVYVGVGQGRGAPPSRATLTGLDQSSSRGAHRGEAASYAHGHR